MKTLFLFRHGKSDWNADVRQDRERPLAPRGIKAARRMGRFLTATANVPDRVLTSPAVRARATADLAAEAGEWSCPVEVVATLYGGAPFEVLDVIRRQEDTCHRLLLAGHEPVWSRLCELLSGARARVPTACLVCIGFPVQSWQDVAAGQGELQWLLPPRLLKAAQE